MVKTVKICFVSNYPPARGRLAEYAQSLIHALQAYPGISHIDIVADKSNNHSIELVNDKITIHRVWRNDNSFFSLLRIPIKILKLKPDIVHFNLHMAAFGKSRIRNFVGLSLPLICRLVGIKSLVTIHNLVEKVDVRKTGFGNIWVNRLGALLATKLALSASAVTITVKSYSEILEKRYKCNKIVWIPHGTWDVRPSNNDHPINNGTFLYIGHTGPYKDLDLLISGFKLLKQRRGEVKLIIAGSSHPNYPEFLSKYEQNFSSKDLHFVGYIPEKKLSGLFQDVDAVVLPYYTCTGTSGVAHLASSFGTPIIATNLPEFRELIREGAGILLSHHHPKALAEKMEEVLTNRKLAHKLREKNNTFANSRKWKKIAKSFYNLYKELSGKE